MQNLISKLGNIVVVRRNLDKLLSTESASRHVQQISGVPKDFCSNNRFSEDIYHIYCVLLYQSKKNWESSYGITTKLIPSTGYLFQWKDFMASQVIGGRKKILTRTETERGELNWVKKPYVKFHWLGPTKFGKMCSKTTSNFSEIYTLALWLNKFQIPENL